MKNKDILSLYEGLLSTGKLTGVIFGYAVNRNMEILKPHINALQNCIIPSEKFVEYDSKRLEIVKNYAKKDSNGNFIMVGSGKNTNYDVGENIDKVTDEVKKLQEEYGEYIKEQDEKINQFNSILDNDVEINLYKVKLENVPKEINAEQMSLIYPIIEE